MEVDSAFLQPLRELYPVLQVVEMPVVDLAKILPIRINLFSFVKNTYTERYGFPIDLPDCPGRQLVGIHLKLMDAIKKRGAVAASFALSLSDNPIGNDRAKYNSLLPVFDGRVYRYSLSYDERGPVVVYDDRLVPLSVVERHINTLAVYCNALYDDPENGRSDLIEHYVTKQHGYEMDNCGRLISRGELHGRWDFETARDLLFTLIINYVKL